MLQRLRTEGVDDVGNVVSVSTDRRGAPLRCASARRCRVSPWRWLPTGPPSSAVFCAKVGPVRIHADACRGDQDANADPKPPVIARGLACRRWQRSPGVFHEPITEGWEAEAAITTVFASPEVAYLHGRNVLAGVLHVHVARSRSAP